MPCVFSKLLTFHPVRSLLKTSQKANALRAVSMLAVVLTSPGVERSHVLKSSAKFVHPLNVAKRLVRLLTFHAPHPGVVSADIPENASDAETSWLMSQLSSPDKSNSEDLNPSAMLVTRLVYQLDRSNDLSGPVTFARIKMNAKFVAPSTGAFRTRRSMPSMNSCMHPLYLVVHVIFWNNLATVVLCRMFSACVRAGQITAFE